MDFGFGSFSDSPFSAPPGAMLAAVGAVEFSFTSSSSPVILGVSSFSFTASAAMAAAVGASSFSFVAASVGIITGAASFSFSAVATVPAFPSPCPYRPGISETEDIRSARVDEGDVLAGKVDECSS